MVSKNIAYLLANVHHMRAAAPGGLSLDLDINSGEYRVKVKDKDWLHSGYTFLYLNGKVR